MAFFDFELPSKLVSRAPMPLVPHAVFAHPNHYNKSVLATQIDATEPALTPPGSEASVSAFDAIVPRLESGAPAWFACLCADQFGVCVCGNFRAVE